MRALTRVLLVVLFAVLFIPPAFSLGVTPARTHIDFAPNDRHQLSFAIVNNERKPLTLDVSLQGSLAAYITYDSQSLTLAKDQDSLTFAYTITLPDALSRGDHDATFFITEATPIGSADGATISTRLSVTTQLIVHATPPGTTFPTSTAPPTPQPPLPSTPDLASLAILPFTPGQPAIIRVTLTNPTDTPYDNAYATLAIYRADALVTTLTTPPVSLLPDATRDLTTTWTPDTLSEGRYIIRATLHYGATSIERTFTTDVTPASARASIIGQTTPRPQILPRSSIILAIVALIAVILAIFYIKKKHQSTL